MKLHLRVYMKRDLLPPGGFPYISLRLNNTKLCFCSAEDCIAKWLSSAGKKKIRPGDRLGWSRSEGYFNDCFSPRLYLCSSLNAINHFLRTDDLWESTGLAYLSQPEDQVQAQARGPDTTQATTSWPLTRSVTTWMPRKRLCELWLLSTLQPERETAPA